MIVEQVWTGNDWRNFNYLIACPDTGEALAVDPLDHEKCLHHAQDQGWEITLLAVTTTTSTSMTHSAITSCGDVFVFTSLPSAINY